MLEQEKIEKVPFRDNPAEPFVCQRHPETPGYIQYGKLIFS
jgi:hypothetical protein